MAAAMIEQQKRKGPELPLVPVKRQRHELLLGAAGSGPGAGQQQAAPGALLQAVSIRSRRPSALSSSSSPQRLHLVILRGPYPALPGGAGLSLLGVKAEKHSKSGVHPAILPAFLHLTLVFSVLTAL